MSDGTKDDLKGRTKEAAGDLTGDKSLKNEGKVDRGTGKVKDAAGKRLRQGQGRRQPRPPLALRQEGGDPVPEVLRGVGRLALGR